MFKSLQLGCFNNPGGCGWSDIAPFINGLLQILVTIGLYVGVIMIAYAGFILLKGQGDANARSKARKIFISVVVGFTILMSAYAIVFLVVDKLAPNAEFRKNL